MAHDLTLGPDTLAHAETLATAIRGDVRSGQAQPLGPHVKYEDPGPGVHDKWPSPAECNASGKASCSGATRAAAPHIDASHVGVQPVKQADGSVVNHAFAIKAAKPGEPGIKIGADGKALSPIPASRIHDEATAIGMNDAKPLPLDFYQGATLAPIWPEHTADLSHVHMPAADRAAEGSAYQGEPRLHVPTTEAGARVAEVAHLAARVVTPPVEHVARPLGELYKLGGTVEEKLAAVPGVKPTERVIKEFVGGLESIAKGEIPVALPTDKPLTEEHKIAAGQMAEMVYHHALARKGDVPHSATIVAKLPEFIAQSDPATPIGDARRTLVSEIDAVLPGVVHHEVRRHLAAPQAAPPRAKSLDTLAFVFPFMVTDADKERDSGFGLGGFGLPDRDLGVGELIMSMLSSRHVGHPGDGHRCAPLPRTADPRMGAAPRSGGAVGGTASFSVPNVPRMGLTPAGAGSRPSVGGGGGFAPNAPSVSPVPGSLRPLTPGGGMVGTPGGMGGLIPPATTGGGPATGRFGAPSPGAPGTPAGLPAPQHPVGGGTAPTHPWQPGGGTSRPWQSRVPPNRPWHDAGNPWTWGGHNWWRGDGGQWFRDGIVIDEVDIPVEVSQQMVQEIGVTDDVETDVTEDVETTDVGDGEEVEEIDDETITETTPQEQIQVVDYVTPAGQHKHYRRHRLPSEPPTVIEKVEVLPAFPPHFKRRHRPRRRPTTVIEEIMPWNAHKQPRKNWWEFWKRDPVTHGRAARDRARDDVLRARAEAGDPAAQAAWNRLAREHAGRGAPIRMAGIGDPRMGAADWFLKDAVIFDPNLRHAIEEWRRNPHARRILEAGGRIRGFNLADVLAAQGERLKVEKVVVDPVMGSSLVDAPGDRDAMEPLDPLVNGDPIMGRGGLGGFRGGGGGRGWGGGWRGWGGYPLGGAVGYDPLYPWDATVPLADYLCDVATGPVILNKFQTCPTGTCPNARL